MDNAVSIANILQGFWPLFLFLGGFIYWLARLESKTFGNTKRIETLEAERSVIYEVRDMVKDMNTRLEILVPNYKK